MGILSRFVKKSIFAPKRNPWGQGCIILELEYCLYTDCCFGNVIQFYCPDVC